MTRCLETFYFTSDHTDTNVAQALKDIHQTWKLPENGQVFITSDNGVNILMHILGLSDYETLRWNKHIRIVITIMITIIMQVFSTNKQATSYEILW